MKKVFIIATAMIFMVNFSLMAAEKGSPAGKHQTLKAADPIHISAAPLHKHIGQKLDATPSVHTKMAPRRIDKVLQHSKTSQKSGY
jgi:hypothetical protein